MNKILLIDDDEKLGDLLGTYFERFDLTLLVANEPETGLEMLGREDPDLVILDVMLPGPGWLRGVPYHSQDQCGAYHHVDRPRGSN